MYFLYIITGILLLFSAIADYKKTFKALKIAGKKILNILPAFLSMIILVSFILYFLPENKIASFISGSNKYLNLIWAALLGSITLMPGFIAFPLCGLLLKQGITYSVIAAFSTTLMLVGIISYPVEKKYFGIKTTILRNITSFIIAIIIAIVAGFAYGEF